MPAPELVRPEIESRCLDTDLGRPRVYTRASDALGECELRCLSSKPCPVCAARKRGDPVISGYATVWDSESRDLGGFVETVSPGSFTEVLNRSMNGTGDNIAALYNHDKAVVLGRHGAGTLKLSQDTIGLRYISPPPRHNWWVAELIDRGDVTGSSYSFANARKHEQWSPRSAAGLPRRNLTGFTRVIDVGPVLFPAFSGTEGHVAARAIDTARALQTRVSVAFPKALAFVGWAREKGLASRSVGDCGQDNDGRFGRGNTCAKGDGGGKKGTVEVNDAPKVAAGKDGTKDAGGDCCSKQQIESFAKEHDHGAKWNAAIGAFVPVDQKPIENLHIANAAAIAKRIGVPDSIGDARIKEVNSANTLRELIADSRAAAPAFEKMVRDAAKAAGGKPFFGPEDKHILKSPKKVSEKIARKQMDFYNKQKAAGVERPIVRTRTQQIQLLDDVVRGSIITDTPEKLGAAIRKFKSDVEKSGGRVEIDNKWDNNANPSGYVGVHAKVLAKTPSGRSVLSEVQFHIRAIYDGTDGSPKDASHAVYEKARGTDVNPKDKMVADAAMQLIFATAAHGIAMGS
jgi:HK97 family phage prohead protease